MCGLWVVMWIFCWKHCLGDSIKSFWVWLLFTIICLQIYHQYVTTIALEAQLEFLKIYFDEKEVTTHADIIEKIRKLPKSCKVYFLRVTTLLKISFVLPATNAVSEQSTLTLHRIKHWLRLILPAMNSALVVISFLAFSVTFATVNCVLKFVLFKQQ